MAEVTSRLLQEFVAKHIWCHSAAATFTKIFASSPSCQPDKSSTDDRAPNILDRPVLKLEGTGFGLGASIQVLYILIILEKGHKIIKKRQNTANCS